MSTFDVNQLPTSYPVGTGDNQVDLAKVVEGGIKPLIPVWVAADLIKENESFGYAVTVFEDDTAFRTVEWDFPYGSTSFVGGWGTDWRKYVANAMNKKRAGLRTKTGTFTLSREYPESFQDIVDKAVDDGTGVFTWGDFPFGGCVIVKYGHLTIVVAVSCLRQVEDDTVALAIVGIIGQTIFKALDPERYAA